MWSLNPFVQSSDRAQPKPLSKPVMLFPAPWIRHFDTLDGFSARTANNHWSSFDLIGSDRPLYSFILPRFPDRRMTPSDRKSLQGGL
jgi:hypothetical protein